MRSLRAFGRLAAVLAIALSLVPLALLSRVLELLGARRQALRFAVGVQRLWAAATLRALGVRVEAPGRAGRGPYLVVANHVSYLDVLVLGSLYPGRFIAKSEIADWPVVGWLSRSVDTLFVRQRERRDVVRVGAELERTFAAGVGAVLFPEAGASRGARIERFHTALLEPAVRSRVPCLAVALSYEVPGSPWGEAWTVAWWGGMGLPLHLWRLAGLPGVRALVRPADAARVGEDRKVLGALLFSDLGAAFRPLRQEPHPPDLPWPELVGRLPHTGGD